MLRSQQQERHPVLLVFGVILTLLALLLVIYVAVGLIEHIFFATPSSGGGP